MFRDVPSDTVQLYNFDKHIIIYCIFFFLVFILLRSKAVESHVVICCDLDNVCIFILALEQVSVN